MQNRRCSNYSFVFALVPAQPPLLLAKQDMGVQEMAAFALKTYPTTNSTAQLGPWAQGPKMDFREVFVREGVRQT
jgi:hypothetical protein